MVKIDLNFQLKWIDGNDIQGSSGHAGKVAAEGLAKSTAAGTAKIAVWFTDLYKHGFCEIEAHEKDIMANLIDQTPTLFAFAKEQIIKAIQKAQ